MENLINKSSARFPGKEGGILSASRKRKLRDQVMMDREQFEAQERAKKYNGPVGKNPWGTIASSWTAKPKERDFADELALFAKQRGLADPVRTKAKFRLGPKDWDDPEKVEEDEEEVDPISASVHRSDSPLGEPVSDEEARWQKKLKRPRMSMVADEVESRKSAKTRLFQGLKRRVANPTTVEYFEEEVEEEEEHEPLLPISRRLGNKPDSDLRMTIKARMDEDGEGGVGGAGKRLNDRFLGKGRSSIMDRLGDFDAGETRHIRRAREDSGDSLERDTGEDLRGELDGRHAANMVIQVANNSEDEEGEAEDDEEMETNVVVKKEKDAGKDKKKVKKTPTKSSRAAGGEVVIKKEKDDNDERKTVRRRSSPVDSKKEVREKIRQAERERARERRSDSSKTARSSMSGDLARRKRGEDSKVGVKSSLSSSKKKTLSKSGRKGGVRIKKEKLTDDESDSSSSDSDSSDSDDSDSSSDSDSSDSSSSDSSSSDSDSSSSSSDSDSEDERSKKRSDKRSTKGSSSSKAPQRRKDSSKGSLGSRDRRTGRREEIRDRMAKKPIGRDRPRDRDSNRDRKGASSSSRRDSERDRRRDDGRKKASASSSSGKKGSSSKDDSEGGLKDKLKKYLKQAKERRGEKK